MKNQVWKDGCIFQLKEDQMRGKTLILFLCLFLVASVSAQNQDKVISIRTEAKMQYEGPEPEVYAQVTQGDKPGVQMLTCYTLDAVGDQWQMIKLSENPYIYWVVEHTGVFNTDVRFYFIMNGPEFYEVVTEWTEAKYKNYYQTILETNNNWKKGTYTVTIIAEQQKKRSGAESICTCRVRFY
jgi:hypothetical protein